MEESLRYHRTFGVNAGELDEVEEGSEEILPEPWDKGIGRPKSLSLREAIMVTLLYTRLSRLCREVFPGQADDVDFFRGWLIRARCLKSCGDEDPAELGRHVGGRWLGFGGVPGSAGAVIFDVGGVVANAMGFRAKRALNLNVFRLR